MRTKPPVPKSRLTSHSTDFFEKEVYLVKLEPFRSNSGRSLVNLSVSAETGNMEDNTYRGQTSILVLDPAQIDALEQAIQDYKKKKELEIIL